MSILATILLASATIVQVSPETLEAKRDEIRNARASGAIAKDATVEFRLAPGDYPRTNTFILSQKDAHTVWKGFGKARLTGGVRVDNSLFKPWKENIFVADVSGVLTETLEPLADEWQQAPKPPLLYVNGEPQTLARWPNSGDWVSFTNVTDTGKSADGSLHPGAFVFDHPRAKSWDFAKGVWLAGYWTHDWHNHYVRAASYDTATHELRLAAPVQYGVACGTWGRKDRRFYAFNILDELDSEGEWFLDREKKLLYFYPPEGKLENAKEIILAVLTKPLLQVKSGAYDVEITGIAFEHSCAPMASASGVQNLRIKNCAFRNGAASGLGISGDHCEISGNELCNLGTYGISVSGGDRKNLVCAHNIVENNHIHDYALFQRTYAAGISVAGCGQVLRGNHIHDAPHNAVLYGGNEHLFESNNVHHVLLETGDAGAFYTGRDWTTQGNVLRGNFVHELGPGDGRINNTMGFYFDDCDCGDEVTGNIFWKCPRGIMIGGGRDHPVRNNIFAECGIGLSIDARGMTWKQWNVKDGGWWLEGKAEALNYKNPPWSEKYPRLAKIMEDSPREPLYNPIENNLFLNCTGQPISLDKNVIALQGKLEISGNVAVYTRGLGKSSKPDPRVKGLSVRKGTEESPIDLGFVGAERGDFRIKPDALLRTILPTLK